MRNHNFLGRFLAAMLAVIMTLSCLPLSAFAAETGDVVPEKPVTVEETTTVEESLEETENVPAPLSLEEGPATPVDISVALAATEGSFTVKGVVTLVDGRNYYVQDDTGGICVRLSAADSSIALGATIQATGTRTDFYGLPQLDSATAELSSGMTLSSKKTTLGALATKDICTYVTVENLTVTAVSTKSITVSDSIGSMDIYNPVTGETKVKKDDVLTFTGAVGVYNGTLQLRNTQASEIVVTTSAPEPEPAPTPAGKTWSKVTDASQLAVGDQIIIVASDSNYALSTNQKSNNRGQATVTKDGDTVTAGAETQILTLESGTKEGTWAFNTGSGYLYAASSASNYLKTQTTLNDNGSWTVEINATGVATVKAQGTNTRNWLRHNSTSSLFSCYSSGQQDISLYKAGTGTTVPETVATPTGTESGELEVGQTVSFTCATEGATLLVKVNDGEYEAYTAPIAITQNTTVTVKATKAGMTDSAEATFTYRAYEKKTQYTLAQTIAPGDQVAIFNPESEKAMTSEGYTYTSKTGATKQELVAADASVADDVLTTTSDKLAVLTVSVDEEGNYTFSMDGKYLLLDGTNVQLADEKGQYTLFNLEKTTDGYYMKSTHAEYNDNPQYLQLFSGYFTCFSFNAANPDRYLVQFYKATEVKSYLDEQGTPDPKPEEPTTVPISDALTGENGASFTVKGVVTFTDGQNIYLQDATGGICLHLSSSDTTVSLGDTLIATGTKSVYNGLTQLSGSYAKSSGLELTARELTAISQLTTPSICTYVELKGVEITEVYDGSGTYTNPNITVKDSAGTTIQLYKAVVTKREDGSWPYAVGDKVNIKAAVGYFNKFQLRNTLNGEITPADTGSEGMATDTSVRQAIAQWGGAGPYADNLQIQGDRYVMGDQKDDGAIFTVQANGSSAKPFQTTSTTTGGTNYYMGGANVGKAENDYLQLAVNTAGWGDMTLAFRMRATNAAPGAFRLCYSKDGGTTWEDFTTGTYSYSYSSYATTPPTTVTGNGSITDGVARTSLAPTNYVSFSFEVPAGAENCQNLLIRLVAGTGRADGDTTKTVSGNIRMDSVVLTGSPLVSGGITGYVTVTPDGSEDQPVGTQLTMTSATEGATISYRINGGTWQTYDAESKPTLEALPADVEAYATCAGKASSVTRLYHYSAGTVAGVKMTPNGGSIWVPSEEEPVQVQMSTTTEGAVIYYMVADTDGNYPVDTEGKDAWSVYSAESPITLAKGFGTMTLKAYAQKAGFTDSAVNEKTFTERASEAFNIYFGQLHSHTNISDGTGTIEEAYAHGKGVETLDFLAVTDHSNSFDNADSGKLNIDGSTISSEWAQAKQAAKNITDDSFVGLYGYEMTWSNGLGHINTYNTAGWQSRTQTDYKTYATALENYYNSLETAPASISQFNHPGTTFGDFQDFAYYTEARDQLITLIEVGNGEGEVGSSGYFPSYEYYTRALDKGWHVAPTNNQDNHKGLWGDANTARSVVLADSLTESAIYDAMRNYRVYATEDNDLNIYYTLDGNIMGSILSTSDVGGQVNVNVLLSDETDALAGTKVQVIVNGGLVAASTTIEQSKGKSISWQEEVSLTVPSSYNYYYIKVVQPDGDIAVTAPVWVGTVEAVGISSLTAESELSIAEEAQNFTLELFNNEKKPLEITSITYNLVTDKGLSTEKLTQIGKDTKLTSVPRLDTASTTFSHTFAKDGVYVVRAVVEGTLNGAKKTYTQDLEVTVVPRNITSTVIVDGTHFNDYVTGYYGGNVNNMVTLAASQSVKVHVETKKITEAMLEDCSLLIISAPAKKAGESNTGSYTAKPFEDVFIDLVESYVKNGGNLIVCGLADYQDKSAALDNHTAAQLNKLLEACGSTMRVNDDEVYDTTNNGGQAYRLYPENFNMASKWCEGLISPDSVAEGENYQTYSQYSGCSIDPGKGTWLVRGFDTTLSVDSDQDEVGNTTETLVDGTYSYDVVTSKGEVVFLAAEDTGYGGTIFAAGGVFVSDFEVKAELDNIWDLPYANRTIYENILGLTRKTPTVTPIADVRKVAAKEHGRIFVVEGYVTAGTDNEYNKFFDTIYIQDDTGGITIFPYAEEGLALGTKVRVTGYTDDYQGDLELQVLSIQTLKDAPKVIEPEKMDNKAAMDYDTNGGKLIQVEGEVVDVIYDTSGKGVAQFELKDKNGDRAKVFIDGYIFSGTTGKNVLASIVRKGNNVSAVGLLYKHPEGDSEESVPVLRVRNCDEIIGDAIYTVTVQTIGNGTAYADKVSVSPEEPVTIIPEAQEGWYVESVVVNGDASITITEEKGKYTFLQPNEDAVVQVTFAKYGKVSVITKGDGTAQANVTEAKAGETVTITVTPKAGSRVKSVVVNGGQVSVTQQEDAFTFSMPQGDADVVVTFEAYYTVTIKESKNGTITVTDETPFAGDEVTITVKPKSGKQVNSVKVLDKDGKKVKLTQKNGKWIFTMPESDVTVSATYKQASSRTGDTSHVYLYAGIMVAAIAALVVLILGRKKWFKK